MFRRGQPELLLGQIGVRHCGIVNADAGRSSGNIHGELEGRAKLALDFCRDPLLYRAPGDDNISRILRSGSGTIINSTPGGDDGLRSL